MEGCYIKRSDRTPNTQCRAPNTDTHAEQLVFDECFLASLQRRVSQYKSTDLICMPSTFGISALLNPWYRERRPVTMNTALGYLMRECLKASMRARHTTQHKPQFGSARGGLPIQWLRLITPRKGISKFPVTVHAIHTAKTSRYVYLR
jgi:hypothetical protein